MRIGTWNLDNRLMTDEHRELFLNQECDVWLLTEVNRKWADEAGMKILHFNCHLSVGVMGRQQHWAAVLSATLNRFALQEKNGLLLQRIV